MPPPVASPRRIPRPRQKRCKRVMARPRKQVEQKRTRVIAFRVTDDEYASIERRAHKADIDIGDFVRHAALRKRITKPQTAPANFEAVDQLRRIGVNFNQIARALNSGGGGLPSSFHALCERVEALLGTLFAEYLGRGSAHR